VATTKIAHLWRGGKRVGRYRIQGHGDSEARHLHTDKEYFITLFATKEEVQPGDILYAGGLNGWEVLTTRAFTTGERAILRCQVRTAPNPEE
jgi:hypothetical protein